jgi:hypothetical protein
MADQSVVLPDNAITDVYVDYENRNINIDNSVANNVIIYTVTTSGGTISSYVDKRGLSLPKTFEAPPVYGSYNVALTALDPDHWWKMNDDLRSVSVATEAVIDSGSAGTLYDGVVDNSHPRSQPGHADSDEWSFKFDKVQEIDWGVRGTQVFPADMATAANGTYSVLFRMGQDDADSSLTQAEDTLVYMGQAADVTMDDIFWVYTTPRAGLGGPPFEKGCELVYEVRVGGAANFYRLTDTGTDLYDGSYHSLMITQDGTAVQVYLDGVNITSRMTVATGGTGADATTWWTDISPDEMTVGQTQLTPIAYFNGNMAHMATWLTALTASDANDLWESIEDPLVGQGTNSWYHLDMTKEYNQMMAKSKPFFWAPMNETTGPWVYDAIKGDIGKGIAVNTANVTFGGAGPGGDGLGHIEIANSGGDESAGIRFRGGPYGAMTAAGRYFAVGGWFYIDETSITTDCAIFNWLPRATTSDGIQMWMTGADKLRFLIYDPGSSLRRTTIQSTSTLSLQNWHYVMMTYEDTATGWRMFIDGTEDTTFTVDPDTTGSTSIIYDFSDEAPAKNAMMQFGMDLDQVSGVATYGTRRGQPYTIRLSQWGIWSYVLTVSSAADHQSTGMNRTGTLISDFWDVGRGV